jgi:signal transduction histidine kinase
VWTHLHVDLPEGGGETTLRSLDALGISLIVLQTAPLAWRRRAPVAVFSLITAALFLFSILGYFRSVASFGFLVGLYTVAVHRDRRISVPTGIAGTLVVFLILVLGPEPIEPDALVAEWLIVGGAWIIGDGFRVRHRQLVQLEDRASLLEREREALAEAAVADERRVIARELHDVVAHNVSVIVAQAGAAQRIGPTHPTEALSALNTIERTGREALVEMRRLMGLLRAGGEPGDPRAPQPGLKNLDALLAQVREAGVAITLELEGEPRAVPAGLDLSAFRIVQEALTNVLKHAGRSRAAVVVRYTPTALELAITDDGTGVAERSPDTSPRRYGHLGMRERVALFGGDLEVGPLEGGGYHVVATLPHDGVAT